MPLLRADYHRFVTKNLQRVLSLVIDIGDRGDRDLPEDRAVCRCELVDDIDAIAALIDMVSAPPSHQARSDLICTGSYDFPMRNDLSAENDLNTGDLFARVIEDLRVDEDSRLSALVALHGRPTRDVVDRSLALCASRVPFERVVGLRVLRELKHQTVSNELLWQPIESVVIRLVTEDEDHDVVIWAISCLGYRSTGADALAAVLRHVDHPNSAVRFAVADALPALAQADLGTESVEALVKLTQDDDADVRSYALMGLVDDLGLAEEKREIVKARLGDTDEHIRRVAREAIANLP